MTIRTFKATLPDLKKIEDIDWFFAQAKEYFPQFMKEGYFKSGQEGVMVVQRVKNTQGDFVGLIACTDIEDYLAGKIVRHERTLQEKERKMMALTKERNALIKPTMLTYLKIQEITDLLLKYAEKYPAYHQINFLGEQHSFHIIDKEKHTKKIARMFKKHLPKVYIADGHHRFATAANLYKQNPERRYFLSALFGSDQLEINEFNRIVETLNDYSPKEFVAQLERRFEIIPLSKPRKPQRVHEIVMHLAKDWHALRLKEEEIEKLTEYSPAERLDVSILNRLVIKDILGIKDVRSDARVRYVEGTKGIGEIQRKIGKKDNRVGFILYPINGKSFIAVSDSGETLPPKSTFFTPRMRNGFIVQRF